MMEAVSPRRGRRQQQGRRLSPSIINHINNKPGGGFGFFLLMVMAVGLLSGSALFGHAAGAGRGRAKRGGRGSATRQARMLNDDSGYNLTLATPDAEFLSKLFATDVQGELPGDDDVKEVVSFQWSRLLKLSHPAPFLLCANSGRDGYTEMLSGFSEKMVLPFFANATLSCNMVFSTASTFLNVTHDMDDRVVYAAPLPSVLKLSKDLVARVEGGAFFQNSFSSSSTSSPPFSTTTTTTDNNDDTTSSAYVSAGLRVVLAPGMEEDYGNYVNTLRRIMRRLRSGAYKKKIVDDFDWVVDGSISSNSSSSSSRRRRLMSRHRRLQKGDGAGDSIIADNEETLPVEQGSDDDDDKRSSKNNGEKNWANRVGPVVDGALHCNFDDVLATIEPPYLRLRGFDKLMASKHNNKRPSDSNSNNNNSGNQTLASESSCLMALLAYVSSDPAILYIEEFRKMELNNQAAAYITQSGEGAKNQYYPIYKANIRGQGQVLQMSDTGVDQNSCFFRDPQGPVPTTTYLVADFDPSKRKIVQYVLWADATDVDAGHGTHVAGTLCGQCIGTNRTEELAQSSFKGVAPGAKLAVFDIGDASGTLSPPANLATRLFPAGYLAGARISSISWGSSRSSSLTYYDTEIDKFMYQNDDFLVVVAAGNGWTKGLGSIFSPANSKNALSVGASENERNPAPYDRSNVAYFTSLGPTFDGRIKPDVVAPGRLVTSASAGVGCGTSIRQGTSMAAPVVAGSAALVRQYFAEGRYPTGSKVAGNKFNPTAALVKAMLINSAVPMGALRYLNGSLLRLGLPPDAYQGHGRIKLDEVMKLAENEGETNLWVVKNTSIAENQKHAYKFSIPITPSLATTKVSTFKVTLVWIDPDTTASAATVVLHNLDLTVASDLDKKTYRPNGLPTGVADTVNTVEKVVLYKPTPGDTLTVQVAGTSIATKPSQNYALVVSGNFISGAWYCQFPRSSRSNDAYTTENCRASCDGTLRKDPICCFSNAGGVCSAAEYAATTTASTGDVVTCDPASKPVEC